MTSGPPADEVAPGRQRLRLLLGAHPADPAALPTWLTECYAQFERRLAHRAYPCFLGRSALMRGELYCTVVDATTKHLAPQALQAFLCALAQAPHERRNLAIFFEPDAQPREHVEYVDRFWAFLQFLHSCDPSPWPAWLPTDCDHPDWEFAFGGQGIFAFCAAPSYQRRSSRNLGPGMVVLMQPRSSFFGLEGGTRSGIVARQRTRQRLVAWDGMTPHPDLGAYGDPHNREWKQYCLSDDNLPASGRCPFTAK